jgi:hypothetical protein
LREEIITFAQGVRHLQAQAARTAGDECGLSGKVKKLLDGSCCHGWCNEKIEAMNAKRWAGLCPS